MEFTGKKVIVTGANGLVGLPTVEKCIKEGADKVYAVDLKFSDNLLYLQQQYRDKIVLVKTELKVHQLVHQHSRLIIYFQC